MSLATSTPGVFSFSAHLFVFLDYCLIHFQTCAIRRMISHLTLECSSAQRFGVCSVARREAGSEVVVLLFLTKKWSVSVSDACVMHCGPTISTCVIWLWKISDVLGFIQMWESQLKPQNFLLVHLPNGHTGAVFVLPRSWSVSPLLQRLWANILPPQYTQKPVKICTHLKTD